MACDAFDIVGFDVVAFDIVLFVEVTTLKATMSKATTLKATHTSTGSHVPKSDLTRKIRPGDGHKYYSA